MIERNNANEDSGHWLSSLLLAVSVEDEDVPTPDDVR